MPYYYAVVKGRQTGIFSSWSECSKQVTGYSRAKFKKFYSYREANNFVKTYSSYDEPSYRPSWSSSSHQYQNYNASGSRPYNSNLESSNYHGKMTNKNYAGNNYKPWAPEEGSDRDSPCVRVSYCGLAIVHYSRDNEASSSSATFTRASSSTSGNSYSSSSGNRANTSFHQDGFQRGSDGYVQCYTDGACTSNGRAGASAGVGVWFGRNHFMNISEPVSGRATNNSAEIEAATRAIKTAKSAGIDKLQINTDSQFLVDCAANWMPIWQRNGWKLRDGGDVQNRVELTKLHEAITQNGRIDVKWNHVRGHSGLEGNEQADRLARAGAFKHSSSNYSRPSSHRYAPY